MKCDVETLGLQGVTGQFVGASDEYLNDIEEQAGFHLPDDYKSFLKKYGASLFSEDLGFRPLVVSPWATNGMESFDAFYGMSETPSFDLKRVNARLHGIIGDQLIAIGHDPGSNLILLDSSGAIFFLDRETDKKYLSASNFSGFLDSFEPRRIK